VSVTAFDVKQLSRFRGRPGAIARVSAASGRAGRARRSAAS